LGDLAPAPGATVVLVGPNGTFSFSPAAVTIHPGETVQWNWAGAPHTVASGVPGAPDGKFCSIPAGVVVSATSCNSVAYAQGIGATYSQTDAFLQPGTYPYFCTVHGALETGTVTSAP
jgi:plastocyanin